jgi:L-aminoacid ligase-like protein
VEFWLSATGIVLGEIHGRPGGDYIHALVEHSRPGLELYGLLLDDLLGLPPAPVPAQTRAAGVDFLLFPPGRLRAVHGWSEVVRHPRVLAADLLVEVGTEVHAATDSLNRHGVIVARSDDPNEVDEVLAELGAALAVDIDRVAGVAA